MLNFLRQPSADELRQKALEDAQRHLVLAAQQAEYYSAMTRMYVARIERLEKETRRADRNHDIAK